MSVNAGPQEAIISWHKYYTPNNPIGTFGFPGITQYPQSLFRLDEGWITQDLRDTKNNKQSLHNFRPKGCLQPAHTSANLSDRRLIYSTAQIYGIDLDEQLSTVVWRKMDFRYLVAMSFPRFNTWSILLEQHSKAESWLLTLPNYHDSSVLHSWNGRDSTTR